MDQNTENRPVLSQLPPHDKDAEQAVLGSLLLDKDSVSEVLEILKPEDFYSPDYKITFEGIQELFQENIPVDAVTLKNKLTEKGVFEQIGGLNFLASLANAVHSSVNVIYYARIVEEKSILRKLIQTSQSIMSLGYEGKENVNAIMEQAEEKIFNIMKNRRSGQFTHIRDVLVDSFDKIEQIFKSKNKITGVPTGFVDIDGKTAGFQPADLILIAARPSMGKTAFALNIVQHAAVRQNIPTAVFSLEMSKEQLVNRMLCSEAMIDAQKLRTGNLDQEDWTKIARAMGPLSESPIYIDDTAGITVADVRAKCRKLKLEKNLGLVMIDYLQLMQGSGRTDSRQQEISDISRSLKAIAKEIDAPVVALSQLSRACETRADHRPMLSDLRESGAIEQDADVVAFLYRDEYYFPDTEKKNQAELIIAKQRNGPTGTVDLIWMGQYTKFSSMQREYEM